MNRKTLVVLLSLLVVLASATSAFAQGPATRPAPQTTPTSPQATVPAAPAPPAATTPATPTAPAVAFTITAISPTTIASSPSEFPATFTLTGTYLTKIDLTKVKLAGGGDVIELKLAAQPTARKATVTLVIPADSNDEYVFWVDGAETKVKLTIKDQATVEAERVKAEAEAAAKRAAAERNAILRDATMTRLAINQQFIEAFGEAEGKAKYEGFKKNPSYAAIAELTRRQQTNTAAAIEAATAALVTRIVVLETRADKAQMVNNSHAAAIYIELLPAIETLKATVTTNGAVVEMVAVNTLERGKLNQDERQKLLDLMVAAGMTPPPAKK